MDLDRLGLPPTSTEPLVVRYREAGIDLPPELLGLYWVHRAMVRAKVDVIRMVECNNDDDSPSLGDIAQYLHTAGRYATASEPVIVVMSGLSGIGKSTAARQLARVLGADHHRSDVVRKELAGVEGAADAAFGEGIYRQDTTAATYERLLELGEESLGAGHPVILDATFLDGRWREAAAELARAEGVPMLLAETVTDDAVLERRLVARSNGRDNPSDADVGIMRRQRTRLAEHPSGVPEGALVATIDTTPEGYIDLDPVLDVLQDDGIIHPHVTGIGANS